MKWKKINEGTEKHVIINCGIKVLANSPEEALRKIHDRLLDLDAKVTDENGEPNQDIIEEYNIQKSNPDMKIEICRGNGMSVSLYDA